MGNKERVGFAAGMVESGADLGKGHRLFNREQEKVRNVWKWKEQ